MVLIAFILLTSSLSLAEESRGVPKKLFGISLGGIYKLGDPETNNFGNIPVKKITGLQKFLGEGIHCYFQPKEEYKSFEYVEKRKKPEDRFFETSFRLYLLPVIPSTIKTIEQLDLPKENWEVTAIEWSRPAKTEEKAYYWAMDLCKTFKADISVSPEIDDDHKEWYACTFSFGDREFRVSSFLSGSVELSYKREVFEAKNEAVDKVIRKLQAEKIRPY